jgi:hypothetical protein
MVEEQERKGVVAHRECECEQARPCKGKIRLDRRIPTRASSVEHRARLHSEFARHAGPSELWRTGDELVWRSLSAVLALGVSEWSLRSLAARAHGI